MLLDLDKKSKVPLYCQIFEIFKEKIERGDLPAESVLPPTRQVAASNRVNRATVQHAYRILLEKGFTSSRVGQGTIVSYRTSKNLKKKKMQRPVRSPGASWMNAMARNQTRAHESTLRNLIYMALEKKGINLAVSEPSPELFPLAEFRRCMNRVLRREGKTLLQHGSVEGYLPLRRLLAKYMQKYQIDLDEKEIIIISGTQQGLDLLSRIFIDRGDSVLMEAPTYPGAIELFHSIGARCCYLPVENREAWQEGLLSQLTGNNIRMIYTIPVCHSPTGIVIPLEARKEFLKCVSAFPVPVIEDFSMGELLFRSPNLPLKALDTRGQVLSLGSFSKQLFPGLRLGWVAAPLPIIEKLKLLRQTSDLHSSLLVQGALAEFWHRGDFQRHAWKSNKVYEARMKLALGSLEQYFPPEVEWIEPEGGFSIWLKFPGEIDGVDLFLKALDHGVVCCPGILFYGDGSGRHRIRLSYSHPDEDALEKGIKILGHIAKETLRRSGEGKESPLLNL